MINLIKMNAEELLDISQTISHDAISQEAVQDTKRERLSAISLEAEVVITLDVTNRSG